jgi:beta-galactosidase
VLWFLWQTYRSGAEQYIVGLLDHAGRPTRFYDEMAATVGELRRVERLLDHSILPPAEVALLVSYESLWALALQPQSAAETNPWSPLVECYAPLYRRNVPVDVLGIDADLTGYRLALVPAPYLADAALATRLEDYVAGGGTLLVTARAGSKDPTNLWPDGPLPGPLRALLGVTVREWDTPTDADGQRVMLAFDAGGPPVTCGVTGWCELLDPEGATPLAHYLDLFYAGAVAATRRAHGRGEVVYAGARGGAFMEHLLATLLARTGVAPLLDTPDGVEATVRAGPDGTLLFLLNHADGERVLDLPPGLVDPVGGQAVSGSLALPPHDARIVRWEGWGSGPQPVRAADGEHDTLTPADEWKERGGRPPHAATMTHHQTT